MIALVNGKPAVLNLQQMLAEYLKHQEEVVTRRTKFNLDKAENAPIFWKGCGLPFPISTKLSESSVPATITPRNV